MWQSVKVSNAFNTLTLRQIFWKMKPSFKKTGVPLFSWNHFFSVVFFFYQGFLTQTLMIHRTAGEGRGPFFIPLYHFHPLTNIQTFVCNFARRWLSLIFNCTACIYQTAIRWDLTPYRITIWSIDDMLIFVRLFDDLILDFDAAIWHEKAVDSNSHRLSPLCYNRIN